MRARHPKTSPAVLMRAAEVVVQRLEERRMLSVYLQDGVWYVEIDDDKNHVITIDINPKDSKKIRAVVDGKVAGTIDIDDIDWVEVDGGGGNDLITSLAGPDVSLFAYGGEGNDTIIGGSASDELSGEEGNDSISGGGGDDYLWGDEGQDTINGGKGDDEIYGDVGSDKIDGGGGDDTIYAGGGDDDIDGAGGDDEIWGGFGDDDIEGDGGEDDIYGGWGDDDLDGGDGGDDLSGDGGDDELVGAAGDDDLEGMDGWDTLAGGLGDDDLWGGRGADQEHGGYGDDEIYGNFGRDTIWGGDGSDLLVGGRDRDLVYSESGDKVQWGRWDRSRNDELVNPLHKVEETELKNWLIDQAVKQYSYLFGDSSSSGWYGVGEPIFLDYPNYWGWGIRCLCGLVWASDVQTTQAYSFKAALADGGAANVAVSHSDTNTQEQGVDEADLVETDGNYIYSIINQQLQIISALPADETQLVSTTDIDGYVTGIYLDGDRLVVLSQVERNFGGARIAVDWYSYRSQTQVTVLDVSDRANPTVVEESVLDGWLTSSRQIDGRLYLVMNNNINLPAPRWLKVGEPQPEEPLDVEDDEGDISQPVEIYWRQDYRYETEAEYRERLQSLSLAELLPQYTTKVRGVDGQMVESSGGLAGQIYVPDDQSHYNLNMASVVLIDLDDAQPGPTAVTNIIGMEGQVYASAQNLYVTTSVWERPMGDWSGEQRTDIYKFSLGASSVDLEATGEVPGWILNSFSMDEEGDYFRLATNTHEGNSSNNLFVLKENADKLEITGGVTGLAFSERIYAARFVGDKAYLVTFPVPVLRWGGPVPQDPLFTIDLSDPTQPTVMGELVIPGYSTYLHPLDDGHLLAVGRDGNDVQVSLFDVSDMSDPRRVDVYTIHNGWYAWSSAENDHHAFAYFPEHHILALPTDSAGEGLATILLSVDDEKGLEKVGQIDSDSWGDQRNLRIGDFIYSFFGQELKVVSLGAPDAVVADVQLPPPPLRPLLAQVMIME